MKSVTRLFGLASLRNLIWKYNKKIMTDKALQNDSIPAVAFDSGKNKLISGENGNEVTCKRQLEELAEEPDTKKAKTQFVRTEPKRKKVAMLLSYCGQGYFGMQRNPNVKSIEEDLLSAMLKAEVINQENYDGPQSMAFQRAARTDKGVSAARQIVSLRIIYDENVNAVEKINANLPDQIRVMSIKRTTKGFNSKFWCDARTYSYTLPTFAFTPINELTCESYRITEDVIARISQVLQLFKGNHNFHNFTSGKKPDDASAYRYIIDFECGKPFTEGELEFVTLKVKGQSFMLHQIRKMIGATIAILRDLANEDIIEKAWNKDKIDIPIAPGLGLVLEEVHYEKYNRRYGNDGIHVALSWDEVNDELEGFKQKHINTPIIKIEEKEKPMFQWLSSLPLHTYDVREAGPPCLPANRSQTRSELGRAMVGLIHKDDPKLETEVEEEDSVSTCSNNISYSDKETDRLVLEKSH